MGLREEEEEEGLRQRKEYQALIISTKVEVCMVVGSVETGVVLPRAHLNRRDECGDHGSCSQYVYGHLHILA